MGAARPVSERLAEKLDTSGGPDACWPFMGSRLAPPRQPYGHIGRNGRLVYTHRLAFELATGIEPGELHVLHRCDNPPCCNPAHLFLGTNADNVADKVAKGRQSRVSKIDPTDVRVIRAERALGTPVNELAARFGLAVSTISNICARRTWKDVA